MILVRILASAIGYPLAMLGLLGDHLMMWGSTGEWTDRAR